MSEKLLSVCLITYNHVKYIKDAIEGVLMQKVKFTWELIIADDFSTDGTREIVFEYKKNHPNFIRLILQKDNVGASQNWIDLLNASKSKYIAYFEGDDYWTDPLKLQKQVDFLEKNLEYSFVFHNSQVKNEKRRIKDYLFCSDEIPDTSDVKFHIDKFRVPSSSIVFRNEIIKKLPTWFKYIYNGDYALVLVLTLYGEAKYLNEVMSVYRKNKGGLNAWIKDSEVWFHIYEMLSYFDIYTDFKYHQLITIKKKELVNCIKLSIDTEKSRIEKLFSLSFYNKKIKGYFKK
jgi:glycosyltransferase involved in cell wall biosynthesis